MNNKLYVGNLDWGVGDEELGQFFLLAGKVRSAVVIMDRDTGRSRGFGFVEMETEEQAKSAILLNGKKLKGRFVVVNAAKDKKRAESTATPTVTTNTTSIPLKPKREIDFMTEIEMFVGGAIAGEEIDFTHDGKRFIIKRA